ncbi:hypothetical protein ACOMHN_026393 [Nucella lapillus]
MKPIVPQARKHGETGNLNLEPATVKSTATGAAQDHPWSTRPLSSLDRPSTLLIHPSLLPSTLTMQRSSWA